MKKLKIQDEMHMYTLHAISLKRADLKCHKIAICNDEGKFFMQ